jgi:hypothetical protein
MTSKFIVFCLLFCSLFFPVSAAEMLLTGVYQGTNVFIINPTDAKGEFCVTEIYINNKKIEMTISGYMEINLSHLKLKDAVNIKIIHKDDCSPTVKNIHAIKAKESFQFVKVDLTATSLVWETKGEKKFGQFFVEIQKNNTWIVEKTMNGKGKTMDNSYEYVPTSITETATYRIKYLEASGKTTYSEEINLKK